MIQSPLGPQGEFLMSSLKNVAKEKQSKMNQMDNIYLEANGMLTFYVFHEDATHPNIRHNLFIANMI